MTFTALMPTGTGFSLGILGLSITTSGQPTLTGYELSTRTAPFSHTVSERPRRTSRLSTRPLALRADKTFRRMVPPDLSRLIARRIPIIEGLVAARRISGI